MDQMDIFLIILVLVCVIGFIRLIWLFYIVAKGYKTKLEFASFSHTKLEYNNGETGFVDNIRVKYRVKNGTYRQTTIKGSINKDEKEPIDIILYPYNESKFIYNNFRTWMYPILGTIGLVAFIILFIYK